MIKGKEYSENMNVNLTIQSPQNDDSGGSSVSSDLNKSIKNIHGFVHGHIHKHKDHTHIHGHIHSHDIQKGQDKKAPLSSSHDHSFDKTQPNALDDANISNFSSPASITTSSSLQSNLSSDLCPLDELPMCEVLCTELDDCYYTNCDDTNAEEQKCCIESDEVDYKSSDQKVCNDPSCLQKDDSTVCCYEPSHEKNHNNNLCEPNDEKILFDQIFKEFQNANNKSFFNEQNTDTQDGFADAVDVHYPHENHPLANTHKAYFHANVLEQNLLNEFGDYDFHFQFDNRNNPTTLNEATVDHPTTVKFEEINDSVACKWDNCDSNINNVSLVDHIFQNHIKDPQKLGQEEYCCQWMNCNKRFNDFEAFSNHLNSHKTESLLLQSSIETMSAKSNRDMFGAVMTPESYDPSGFSSKTTTPPKTKSINDIKISNMNIKKKNDLIDPEYTCKWEVDTADGIPIQCNKKHQSAGELQDHLIDDHIGSGRSSYDCKWVGCERHNGKSFPQRQKLLRHIHVHTNYKPWICSICNSSFAVESMLIQHLRVHSGEKPFKCNKCGKSFATSSSLSIHNRVHTGEKPLVCKFPGCSKKFSESSNLTKHMKTHVKNFVCPTCNIHFDRKSIFLKHMKTHESKSNDVTTDTFYNVTSSREDFPPLKQQKISDLDTNDIN